MSHLFGDSENATVGNILYFANEFDIDLTTTMIQITLIENYKEISYNVKLKSLLKKQWPIVLKYFHSDHHMYIKEVQNIKKIVDVPQSILYRRNNKCFISCRIEDRNFIIYRQMDGTLEDLFRNCKITHQIIKSCESDILKFVTALHLLKLFHYDIKMDNIMYTKRDDAFTFYVGDYNMLQDSGFPNKEEIDDVFVKISRIEEMYGNQILLKYANDPYRSKLEYR
jgi:serine/threonine protein kinase